MNNFQHFFLTLQRSADTKQVHFRGARRFAGRVGRSRNAKAAATADDGARRALFGEKRLTSSIRRRALREAKRKIADISAAFSNPVRFRTYDDAAARTKFSLCSARRAGPPCGRSGKKGGGCAAASRKRLTPLAARRARYGETGETGETGGARARCALHEVKRTNKRCGEAAPQPCCAESAARRAPAPAAFASPAEKREMHYPRGAAFCEAGNKRSN